MSRFFALSLAFFFTLASLVAGSLELSQPSESAVVSQFWPNQKEFLLKSEAERRALVADDSYRHKIKREPGRGTLPKPVDFSWTWDGSKAVSFTLKIAKSADFSDAVSISSAKTEAQASNFEMNRKYYWLVVAKTEDGQEISSKPASFSTEDFAPRLLSVPNVTNFRDLGGRVGLDGKRVRQNMIFRNTAFNENSKDGVVHGKDRFTDEGRKIALDVLKLKTELDLRSKKEVADMAGSPLGDQVKWINISTKQYGGAHEPEGKEILIREFKLFCSPENYPIDVHCIAGADRTGTLCFILNAALGVSDEELLRDWEITIFDNSGSYFQHKKALDFLLAGFDKLGSPNESYAVKVERYLLSGGVSQEELAAFRSAMLEK